MRAKVFLGLLLAALLLLPTDTLYLSPARTVASAYLFSLEQFEVTNLPRKWLHFLWETLPGKRPSREERLALLDEYLLLARRVQKEEDRLEGLNFRSSPTRAVGGVTKEQASLSREYLKELLKAKEKLRARAEEAVEAELSAVLNEQGLGSWLGILFPPPLI